MSAHRQDAAASARSDADAAFPAPSSVNGSAAAVFHVPSFSNDPVAHLQALSDPASLQHTKKAALLTPLSGSVAACLQDPHLPVAACGHYLRAAAIRLAAACCRTTHAAAAPPPPPPPPAPRRPAEHSSSLVASVLSDHRRFSNAVGSDAAAFARAGSSSGSGRAMEENEVLKAIGYAVARCPRTAIAETGILPVLAQLQQNRHPSSSPDLLATPTLTPAHVELMQACIFAGDYQYVMAASLSSSDAVSFDAYWPRPSSHVTIEHVLRYYYLRGHLHLATQQRPLALRCWNITMTLPAHAVSAIQVAAWKKWILVSCLEQVPLPEISTQLPLATPNILQHFLANSTGNAGTGGTRATIDLTGGAAASVIPNVPGMGNNDDDEIMMGVGEATGSTDVAAAGPDQLHEVNMVEVEDVTNDAVPAAQRSNINARPGAVAAPNALDANANFGVIAYQQLVQAFHDMQRTQLAQLVNQYGRLYEHDGNLGLVHQVQDALLRRQVIALSRVYVRMPRPELLRQLEMPEHDLPQLLADLAQQHDWTVQPEEHDVLHFPPFAAAAAGTAPTTDQNADEVQQLVSLVQQLDAQVSGTARYQNVMAQAAKKKKGDPEKTGPRGVDDL